MTCSVFWTNPDDVARLGLTRWRGPWAVLVTVDARWMLHLSGIMNLLYYIRSITCAFLQAGSVFLGEWRWESRAPRLLQGYARCSSHLPNSCPRYTSPTARASILPSRASGPDVVVVRLSGYCSVVLCVSVVLQEMLERYRILRLIKETHKWVLISLSTETDLSLHK